MGEASRRKKEGSYPDKTTKAVRESEQGCLDWRVTGDLAGHPKSAALIDALISLKQIHDPNLGGKTMTVLFETSDRKPVLVARAIGMSAWVSLIKVFQALGLNDRLEQAHDPVDGYDAIFS
jgi:hypothetical protein